MEISKLRSSLCLLAACGLVAASGCSTTGSSAATEPGQHIVIVRHAEKEAGDDPALTAAGTARAAALADHLEGIRIDHVFSTDTRRTRSTAAPVAQRRGVPVEIYDHREGARLVERLLASGESALVVGHSNTIAGLAQAFGARPGEAVREDEYDRLYVIRLSDQVVSEIRRYGNDSL